MENSKIRAVFYFIAHVCVPQGNVSRIIHEIIDAVIHDTCRHRFGHPGSFDQKPGPLGGGNVNLAWMGNLKLKCRDGKEEYKCIYFFFITWRSPMKRERFVSKLLRMKSFTAQFDAYKRITQQQHRNIISDFA